MVGKPVSNTIPTYKRTLMGVQQASGRAGWGAQQPSRDGTRTSVAPTGGRTTDQGTQKGTQGTQTGTQGTQQGAQGTQGTQQGT